MLRRDFLALDDKALAGDVATIGGVGTPSQLCMLVVHHRQPRLLALIAALADDGYCVVPADGPEDAAARIGQLMRPDMTPPNVLLLEAGPGHPMPSVVFARECLARCQSLRVLYLSPRPWPATVPLMRREHLLRVPFTATTLAATLAAL